MREEGRVTQACGKSVCLTDRKGLKRIKTKENNKKVRKGKAKIWEQVEAKKNDGQEALKLTL